jgi:hypothetical protein
MSDELLSPNKKKRKKCVQCQILFFKHEQELALSSNFRSRASFFAKQVTTETLKLEKEQNFAKLHICAEHMADVRKLRKLIFTQRRRSLVETQKQKVKLALNEVNELRLRYAEINLRLGPDHEFTFRAQLKLEHANRVLAQRTRRLKEIS